MAVRNRAESVPFKADAGGVHLVTPGRDGGWDGRPLLRVELHVGVAVLEFQPSAPTAIAAVHNHLYIVSRRADQDGDPTQVWAY